MVNSGWADLDRGLFSISVAAELAGLHPQTLRIYEREGLLDPARSAGGTRRYSRRDIDRLAEICALTADGLNLAGIRRVLQLQEETRQLHAEITRLRQLADGPPPPPGQDPRSAPARPAASSGARRPAQLPGSQARARTIAAAGTRAQGRRTNRANFQVPLTVSSTLSYIKMYRSLTWQRCRRFPGG